MSVIAPLARLANGYLYWSTANGDGLSRANVYQLIPPRRFSALVQTDRLFLVDEVMHHGQYVTALRSVRSRLSAHGRPVRIIDAGANVGLFALFARMTLGLAVDVVGFEPLEENRALCESNWAGLRHELRPEALADSAGSTELHLVSTTGATIEAREAERWAEARGVAAPGTRTVQTMTLDELGLDEVDLIKLDIEGAESRALAGAAETIARTTPVILCSYEHHTSDPAVIGELIAGMAAYSVTDDVRNRLLLFVPDAKKVVR